MINITTQVFDWGVQTEADFGWSGCPANHDGVTGCIFAHGYSEQEVAQVCIDQIDATQFDVAVLQAAVNQLSTQVDTIEPYRHYMSLHWTLPPTPTP